MIATGNVMQRLMAKAAVDAPSGCWLWTACRDRHGYGKFPAFGETLAHRVAYRLFRGPIAEGMTIDHLCRNRGCVNPAHMEVVTRVVNILRGNTFSGVNARKTHCDHGHEFSEDNTRTTSGYRTCRTCQREAVRRYRLRRKTR